MRWCRTQANARRGARAPSDAERGDPQATPRRRAVRRRRNTHAPDRLAHRREGRREELLHERLAPAAPGARLGARLEAGVGGRVAGLDGRDDVPLAHGVARADGEVVAHGLDAGRRGGGAVGGGRGRSEQGRRLHAVEAGAGLVHPEEGVVVGRVADQHAAAQPRAVGREDELAVDLGNRVVPHERDHVRVVGRREVVVAERRHVDAHELELGGHVGAGERRGGGGGSRGSVVGGGSEREHVLGGRVGHQVPGRDEAVDHAAVQGALPDREDALVGRPQRVVDQDPAPLVDVDGRRPGRAGDLVARPDPGRDHHHLHRERVPPVVGEAQAARPPRFRVKDDLARARPAVHLEAEVLDHRRQEGVAGRVDLPAHENVGELDDVRLAPEVVHRFGRLEPEEPAADDRGALDVVLRVGGV